MPYLPKEVVERVREMDLLTYLKTYEPQELVHFGGNTYCTREHDSLKISNGKWYWFSQKHRRRVRRGLSHQGKDMPFLEAVQQITGQAAVQPPVSVPKPKDSGPKVLLLPKASRCATHAVGYLMHRGIDEDIIPLALEQYLKDYPEVKTIRLRLDNDRTGRQVSEVLMAGLSGRYAVSYQFPPKGKDYNDYLCMVKRLPIMSPRI